MNAAANIRRDHENRERIMENDIRFYALSTCSTCKDTKAYLDQCGVKYKCVYVDKVGEEQRKDIMAEVKAHGSDMTFPTMIIGKDTVVGFDKKEIDKALSK